MLGDVGELVCTQPFPSMPTSFWNDKSGEKYKRAYFSQWPGEKPHKKYKAPLQCQGVQCAGAAIGLVLDLSYFVLH